MTEEAFAQHRRLLFTVAYEMLGSASDAEDVVQETRLRWDGVDQAQVRDPRAYLVRIVTRQALNRLRTLARRREDYVDEWLPEPVLTGPETSRACSTSSAPDVVLVADGGGVAQAAPRPLVGADRVARFLMGASRLEGVEASTIWINGGPGARIDIGGVLDTAVGVAVEDGRITRFYAIRNPDKLTGLADVAEVVRS